MENTHQLTNDGNTLKICNFNKKNVKKCFLNDLMNKPNGTFEMASKSSVWYIAKKVDAC